MKKKSLLMMLLFLLVTPLAACGDKEVKVSLSLEKQVADAQNGFALKDCAELSGGGDYVSGANVTIVLSYVAATCDFASLFIEETGQSLTSGNTLVKVKADSSGIAQVKYTMHNLTQNRTIKVYMMGKGATAASPTFKYMGIHREYYEAAVGDTSAPINDYLFATSSGSGDSVMTSVKPEDEKEYEVKGKKLNTYLKKGNDPTPDLNYIFELDKKEGTYTLVPYKLRWEQAAFENGTCKAYVPLGDDIDINEYVAQSGTCLRAIVAQRIESYDDRINLLKEVAEKILTDKVIISFTDKADEEDPVSCEGAGSKLEHSQCMYVNNISKLTDGSKEHSFSYFGFRDTDDEHSLEAVIGGTNKDRLYYALRPTGKGDDSYETITMKYTMGLGDLSESLQTMISDVNSFISAIEASSNPGVIITGYNIKFSYTKASGLVIESFEGATNKYSMTFVKNSWQDSRLTVTENIDAKNYNIEWDLEALETEDDENIDLIYKEDGQQKLVAGTLASELLSNPFNTIFKTNISGALLSNAFREVVSTIIYKEGNESLRPLADYYFTVSVTGDTMKITPSIAAKTILTTNISNEDKIVADNFNYFITPKNGIYACQILSYEDNGKLICAEEMANNERSDISMMIDFIRRMANTNPETYGTLNHESISKVKILQKVTAGATGYEYYFTYTVGETSHAVKIIVVESSNIEDDGRVTSIFIDDKEYVFTVQSGENLNISTLTSTSKTVIGTIVQIYTPNPDGNNYTIETTINGEQVSGTPDEDLIKRLYNLLAKDAKVYKPAGVSDYWYLVDGGEGAFEAQICMIKITRDDDTTT